MTPLSVLFLVVGVFSSFLSFFFFLLSLARGLSVYWVFSKNQLLASLVFFIDFLFSTSFIFALVFIISFLLFPLGLYCSSFCKLIIWTFDFFIFRYFFSIICIHCYKFPFKNHFLHTTNFDKLYFHFCLKYLEISLVTSSLTHYLEMCCLNAKYLGIFQLFLLTNFQFDSTGVWKHTLYNLYSFEPTDKCFMAQIWSILVSVTREFEKNVYSDVKLFYKYQLDSVDWWCCSGQIYPYNFLPDRSVNYWQMLKSLPKRVILSFSHCISISFCLMNFNTLLLSMYRSELLHPLGKLTSLSLHNTFFISDNFPCSEVCLVQN